MVLSTFKYYKMSTKPITLGSLQKTHKQTYKQTSVKPVTLLDISLETKEEEYYRKYGIIYAGNDLKSCISSLFN